MTSILENEPQCPVCKDSDCVESVRHDNCTACGWAQFTPIESPSHFQLSEKLKCLHAKKCNCDECCKHCPQPPSTPVQERDEAALHRAEKEMGLYEDKPAASGKCDCPDLNYHLSHPMCGRPETFCSCSSGDCKPDASEKCFCGGNDQAGHLAMEGHTEHKPCDDKCTHAPDPAIEANIQRYESLFDEIEREVSVRSYGEWGMNLFKLLRNFRLARRSER